MTHAQVAKRVRLHKQTWPELYCPTCLWRVKHDGRPDTPCPKHMRTSARIVAEWARDFAKPQE